MTFALIAAPTLGNLSAARVTLDSTRPKGNEIIPSNWLARALCCALAGMRTAANDSLTSTLVGFDIQIASSARLLQSIIVDSSWSFGRNAETLEDSICQGAAPDLN